MVFNYFSTIKSNTAPPAYSRRFGLEASLPTPPKMPTPAPDAASDSLNAFPSTGIEDMIEFASAMPLIVSWTLPICLFYVKI